MKKINLAILGAGRIAGHHIKALKKDKNFQLVSICDLIEKKAHFYRNGNISIYKNFEQMIIDNPEIDIVAIMSPSGMHYEHAMKIISKYKKHVIIEKPIVMRLDQLSKLYYAAKKNKCKIFPVYQNRYNLAVRKVQDTIKKNKLGKINIVNVRVRWCRPQRYYDSALWRGTFSHDGGVLTNQGIHHIDLLSYLAGEIKSLYCKMSTLGSKLEAEDTVVAVLKFTNGAVGSLEITTAARPIDFEASISIIGSKGLAQLGGLAVNEIEKFTINEKDKKKFSEKIPDAYGFGHFSFYKDVAKTMNKNIKFPHGFEQCKKTLKLIHAFYRSDEMNKEVFLNKAKNSKRLGRNNEKVSKFYTYKN